MTIQVLVMRLPAEHMLATLFYTTKRADEEVFVLAVALPMISDLWVL